MAPPATPPYALSAEELLLFRETNNRIENIEKFIKDLFPTQAKESFERVAFDVATLKTSLLSDLKAIQAGFEDVESGLSAMSRNLTEQITNSNMQLEGGTQKLLESFKAFGGTPAQLQEILKSLRDVSKGAGEVSDKLKRTLSAPIANDDFETSKVKYINNFKNLVSSIVQSTSGDFDALKAKLGDETADFLLATSTLTKDQFNALSASERTALLATQTFQQAFDNLDLTKFNQFTESLKNADGIKSLVEQLRLEQELNNAKRARYEIEYPLLKLQEMEIENEKKLSSEMSNFANKLTFSSTQTNNFASALNVVLLNSKGVGDGIGRLGSVISTGLANSFLDPVEASNRFFNFLEDKLIKSAFRFNSVIASINKETGGMGKEFESVAISNQGGIFSASNVSSLAMYGVSLEKFSKTYASLSVQISSFNALTDYQRSSLSRNAASFETLGLSTETYARLASALMGSLGKTVDGVRTSVNDLAKDSIALGRDLGEYTNAYISALPKLTAYASDASAEFKRLASFVGATNGQLKETDLLSFTSQFDTFEQAAESAAKLNAVLGGTSVNALDLMRADPSERIMAIKRAAEDAGLKFDGLNRGYKQLLAEYFSGDVSKAAAFFNADIQKAQELLNKSSETEAEIEERKRKSVSAQEKLNIAIENMSIALTPVVKLVDNIANLFIFLNDNVGSFATFMLGLGVVAAPFVAAMATVRSVIRTTSFEMQQTISTLSAQIAGLATTAALPAPSITPIPAPPSPTPGRIGGLGMLGLIAGGLTAVTLLGSMVSSNRSMDEVPSVNDGIFRQTPGRPPELIGRINSSDAVQVYAGLQGGPVDKSMGMFGMSSSREKESYSSSMIANYASIATMSSVKSSEAMSSFSEYARESKERNSRLDSQVALREKEKRESSEKAITSAFREVIVNNSSNSTSVFNTDRTAAGQPRELNITLNADFEKLAGVIKKKIVTELQEIA